MYVVVKTSRKNFQTGFNGLTHVLCRELQWDWRLFYELWFCSFALRPVVWWNKIKLCHRPLPLTFYNNRSSSFFLFFLFSSAVCLCMSTVTAKSLSSLIFKGCLPLSPTLRSHPLVSDLAVLSLQPSPLLPPPCPCFMCSPCRPPFPSSPSLPSCDLNDNWEVSKRDKDTGWVFNAWSLAWNAVRGLVGNQARGRRGRRWIRQLHHSLVGFVDPIQWLLRWPLLYEDVGMPALWQWLKFGTTSTT